MGKRTIILAAALTAALASSMPAYALAPEAALASPFSDVKTDDWFAGAVVQGKEMGIIDGYKDGTFRPQRKLSYGEFIKMAVKGQKAEGAGTHWASGCYNYASEMGYLTSRDISQNMLDMQIPRKYMALIFANILASKGHAEGEVASAPFSDVSRSDRFEYQISVCVKSGVLSGYTDGTFRPDEVLTRAEAASALVRFFRLIGSADYVQEYSESSADISAEAPDASENTQTVPGDGGSTAAATDISGGSAAKAPSDAADSSYKEMLDGILSSLRCSEGGRCTLSYSKPQIPADRHFSLRINMTGAGDFYYQSDAGYRSDPSLYDPSAGSFSVDIPGVSTLDGSNFTCLLSLSASDGSRSVSYQLQRTPAGELSLYMNYHNGGSTSRVVKAVPEGTLGR